MISPRIPNTSLISPKTNTESPMKIPWDPDAETMPMDVYDIEDGQMEGTNDVHMESGNTIFFLNSCF